MTQDIYPPPRAPGLMDVVYFTNVDDGGYFNKADYPGAQSVRVRCQGGGGGGMAATAARAGAGGGGGGYAESLLDIGLLASSETVTVGGGGNAGTTSARSGGSGGQSSFGSHCSANGGGGAGASAYYGSNGGSGTGDIVVQGGAGGSGADYVSTPGGNGGTAHLGGGGRGDRAFNPTGGANGNLYGGGGGGGNQDNSGGAGADGIVIVEVYSTYVGNTGDFVTRQYIEAAESQVDTVEESSTSRTLQLSDAGKIIEATNASTTTVTVPTNASVPFPINTVIGIYSGGAGGVDIVAAAGTVIRRRANIAQYGETSLRKRGTDEWVQA